MKKFKDTSIAGTFYCREKEDLKAQIESFSQESKNYYKNSTRAVIVPHAGLIYSGKIAYEGLSQLDKNIKTIFIFAPAHKMNFKGLALSSYQSWKTPLGKININKTISNELEKDFGCIYNDEVFENEHSIEVEIPLIQYLFENVKIVPILIGDASAKMVCNIISKYYENKKIGFVISSDLSHFLSDEQAKIIDSQTASMIESGHISGFTYEQACGAIGIVGLVLFANNNNYNLIRIDMANSAAITEDKSRVVGYGSWFLYEGDKNQFIKDNYSNFIVDLVRNVLISSFNPEKSITINYPQIFDELGACFVTLEKNGILRGCIGSILAYRPLITDIIEHSKNSAFKDKRFLPLTEDELKDLKISVSILTAPKQIVFETEEELLNKIIPFEDGIIIKDGNYQAVYLPVVWEQIPDKKEFLNSLKLKAGLSKDYFSTTFEAYKFHSVYIN